MPTSLCWGHQGWTQYLGDILVKGRTEQENHLAWLVGLSSFDADQNTIGLLGCKFTSMVHVSTTRTPKSFSAGLFSIYSSLTLQLRCKCSTLHLALLNCIVFAWIHLSSLSTAPWMASLPSVHQLHQLQRVCSVHVTNENIKLLFYILFFPSMWKEADFITIQTLYLFLNLTRQIHKIVVLFNASP